MSGPRVIVALDFPDERAALALAGRLAPSQCRLKVGKELFTAAGPALIDKLSGAGFTVFLDLKFHDIPDTVASACRAAARLGAWMINVHALGGRAMMSAAREAMEGTSPRPLLTAVTLLTSMAEGDLGELGIGGTPREVVLRLASLARSCGLDGAVCSAQEARMLRMHCGLEFCLVTPGIRPAHAEAHDQKRIMTPRAAIEAGADYLVIGRPITRAADPAAVLRQINDEIAARKGES